MTGDRQGQADAPTGLAAVLGAEAERLVSPWWDTPTAEIMYVAARELAFVQSFASLIEVLRHGINPDWAVGGSAPGQAVAVAWDWVRAGVDPRVGMDVSGQAHDLVLVLVGHESEQEGDPEVQRALLRLLLVSWRGVRVGRGGRSRRSRPR